MNANLLDLRQAISWIYLLKYKKELSGFNKELIYPHPIFSPSPSIKYMKLVVSINELKPLISYTGNRLNIHALTPKIIEGFDKELTHLHLILSSFLLATYQTNLQFAIQKEAAGLLPYNIYLPNISGCSATKLEIFGNELTHLDPIHPPSPWLNWSKIVFYWCEMGASLSHCRHMSKIFRSIFEYILDIYPQCEGLVPISHQ